MISFISTCYLHLLSETRYNYSPRKSLAFVPHKSDHNVLKYQKYVYEVSLKAHIRTIHLKERDGSGLNCKGRHLNCLLFPLCFIADGKKSISVWLELLPCVAVLSWSVDFLERSNCMSLVWRNKNKKFRSYKSKENIHKKGRRWAIPWFRLKSLKIRQKEPELANLTRQI